MAAKSNSTTAECISYESPDGRVKVVRHGPRDFGLYLDGMCVNSFDYSYQAEHEGAVWLAEQAAAAMATQSTVLQAPEVFEARSQTNAIGSWAPATVKTGSQFIARTEMDRAEVYFPDVITPTNRPILIFNHEEPIDLDDAMRLMPLLQALLGDEQVRARWEALQQQEARRKGFPNMTRIVRMPVEL